jgi:hypothetical protein
VIAANKLSNAVKSLTGKFKSSAEVASLAVTSTTEVVLSKLEATMRDDGGGDGGGGDSVGDNSKKEQQQSQPQTTTVSLNDAESKRTPTSKRKRSELDQLQMAANSFLKDRSMKN